MDRCQYNDAMLLIKAAAKVMLFFELAKLFVKKVLFFTKKHEKGELFSPFPWLLQDSNHIICNLPRSCSLSGDERRNQHQRV